MRIVNYCIWVPYEKGSDMGRTYLGSIHVLAHMDVSLKLKARFPGWAQRVHSIPAEEPWPTMCFPTVRKEDWIAPERTFHSEQLNILK